MIGHVLTTWVDTGEYLTPDLPEGHGVWSDVTGEVAPVPPGMVVVEVEAEKEWFDLLPEGAVLWTE